MGMYMLCPWWVYICGSNGEQVSLSTKVDLACASSPLPALSACLGLPPGSSLSFSPHTQELHPYQQLDHKGVKATGGQFIHISLMTTRLIWKKKMTLNVQRWASLQGSPNKHPAWHLFSRQQRSSCCLCVSVNSQQIYPCTPPYSSPPNPSGGKKD